MIRSKCLVCGSSDFRADRALSGRLVCISCGTPYGGSKGGRNRINNFNRFSFLRKYWFFFFIFIFAFILVIV